MRTSPRLVVALWCAAIAFACLSLLGQQGAVTFKHFKVYPAGQWAQEIQAYRGGVPVGPVQRSTTCSSPLSVPQAAAAMKMGNDAAPMCRMKVLKDEERTAEYEQSCNMGPQEQVIHSTMQAIDDRTLATEIRNSIAGHEMSFARITSRYTGACATEQATPALPVLPMVPKPSAEECAEVSGMKRQVEETTKGCATDDMPASDRANCIAAMKRLASNVKQMEDRCK